MAPRGIGGHSPAEMVRQLRGIHFPANKRDLIDRAAQNHAPSDVLDELRRFQEGEYRTMADVMKAYGKLH
jgi:hypothetical protein